MLKACLLMVPALLILPTGCGRTLYHYHRTVVGLDISGNVAGDTPSGHLTLGYSRRLVILMPPEIEDVMREKPPEPGKQEVKLPSTIFCTQVRASLGGVNAFREVLATGTPAESYAKLLAAKRPNDDKLRNFVCPGYEILEADPNAATKDTKKAEPRAVPK